MIIKSKINDPKRYSGWFGPNSNTAADGFLKNIGGITPNVPGAYEQGYGE